MSVAAKKGGKAGKVDVCHITGNGGYVKINISANALPAHLAHGDQLPGEGGLDDDCGEAPADRKIVFYSNRDGDYEVYSMDPNGSNQTNITNDPTADDGQFVGGHPRLSPDGTKVLYTSYGAGDPLGDLFVIAADGSGTATNLTLDPSSKDSNADWSPDGSTIVFAKDDSQVWVINPDGTGLSLLIDDGGWPSWSPDGSRIAFTSYRDGKADIWVMNADGTGQTNLTFLSASDDWDAEWSPDGSTLAFESTRADGFGFGNIEIIVMDATDGSGQTNVSNNPAFDAWPAWSPNGRIVFTSGRDGSFDTWVMDADRSSPANLSQAFGFVPGDDSWPSWF